MKYTRKCKVNAQQNQQPRTLRLFEPGVERRVSLIVDRGNRDHLVPGTNITMEELHRYQLLGRQLQARAMAAAFKGLFSAVGRGIGRLVTGLRRARVQAAAIRELAAMDDHLLQDIGIRRDSIAAAVAGLMDRPAAAPPTPARDGAAKLCQQPACNQPHGKAAA